MINLNSISWTDAYDSLNQNGYFVMRNALSADECAELKQAYADPQHYRSVISMERYRFGKGEYKYFQYPLPKLVRELRLQFYPFLAQLANEWMAKLNLDISYPPHHHEFIQQCEAHGQGRPTPLILRYTSSGFNTLHQDLYGEIYFPFQVVIVLSEREREHHGGELVFVEQLPRAQSRAEVVSPSIGDAVIFTTNFRPVKGTKGYYRAKMKHGISPVRAGERYALGIIFHDAA